MAPASGVPSLLLAAVVVVTAVVVAALHCGAARGYTLEVGSDAGADVASLQEALAMCATQAGAGAGCTLLLQPGQTHVLSRRANVTNRAFFRLASTQNDSADAVGGSYPTVLVDLEAGYSSVCATGETRCVAPLMVENTATVAVHRVHWRVNEDSLRNVGFSAESVTTGNVWENATRELEMLPAVTMSVHNAGLVKMSNVSFEAISLQGEMDETSSKGGLLSWNAGVLLNDTAMLAISRARDNVTLDRVHIRDCVLRGGSTGVAIRNTTGPVRMTDWHVKNVQVEHGHVVAVAESVADIELTASRIHDVSVFGVGSPIYMSTAPHLVLDAVDAVPVDDNGDDDVADDDPSSSGTDPHGLIAGCTFDAVVSCGAHAASFSGPGRAFDNILIDVHGNVSALTATKGRQCAIAQPSTAHPSATFVQHDSDAPLVVQGNNLTANTGFPGNDHVQLAWTANDAQGVLIRNNIVLAGSYDVLGDAFAVQCPRSSVKYYDGLLVCHEDATCVDLRGADPGTGFDCQCESPYTGNPLQECVAPPGEISPVPNPLALGDIFKPEPGNSTVSLINSAQNKVDFDIYTPEEFCNSSAAGTTILDLNGTLTLCGATGSVADLIALEEGRGLTYYDATANRTLHEWILTTDKGANLKNKAVQACSFVAATYKMYPDGLHQGDYFSVFVLDSRELNGGAKILEILFDIETYTHANTSAYRVYEGDDDEIKRIAHHPASNAGQQPSTFFAGDPIVVQALPYDVNNLSIPLPIDSFDVKIAPASLSANEVATAANLSLGIASCSTTVLDTLKGDGVLPGGKGFNDTTGLPPGFPVTGVSYFKCPTSPLYRGAYDVFVRTAQDNAPVATSVVSSVCSADYVENGARCTCPAGQYLDADSLECLQCPDGTSKDFVGDDECSTCPPNSEPNVNASACSCVSTHNYVFSEDEQKCACAKGYKYQSDGLPCLACETAQFKDVVENTVCKPCPNAMTTAKSGSTSNASCICLRDTYRWGNDHSFSCSRCPQGAQCDEQGVALQALVLDDGYWRATATSHEVLACPAPTACRRPSGAEANMSYGDNLCATGHEGPYCSVCEEGRFKRYDGLCEECSPASLLNSYILLTVLGCIFFLLIYYLAKVTRTLAERAEDHQEGHKALSIFDHLEKTTLRVAERNIVRMKSKSKSKSKRSLKSESTGDKADAESGDNADDVEAMGSPPASGVGAAAVLSPVGGDAHGKLTVSTQHLSTNDADGVPQYRSGAGNGDDPTPNAGSQHRKKQQQQDGEGESKSADAKTKDGDGDGNDDDDAAKQSMNARTIIVKLKIAFVFFQVVLLFQDTYLVAFPSEYLQFLDLFSFLQLDFFRVAQMECAVKGGFGSKLILSTTLPLGAFMILGVVWCVAFLYYRERGHSMVVVENTLINLFLVITYVLFPSLATTIFSTFVCEKFDDGTHRLRADYSISCESDYYSQLVVFASFMIIVYPIGIPALYAWFLFSRRDMVNPQRLQPDMKLSQVVYLREAKVNYLKFLFDAYKPSYYWMEVFECLRKLALTGFVVFLFEGSALQIYCGVLVSIGSVMLYCYTRPFLFRSNNYFSIFAHTQITITLIGVSMLRYNQAAKSIEDSSEHDSQYSNFDVAMLLICSNVSVLVIGTVLVLYSCVHTSESEYIDAGYVSDGKGGYIMETNDEVFAATARGPQLMRTGPEDSGVEGAAVAATTAAAAGASVGFAATRTNTHGKASPAAVSQQHGSPTGDEPSFHLAAAPAAVAYAGSPQAAGGVAAPPVAPSVSTGAHVGAESKRDGVGVIPGMPVSEEAAPNPAPAERSASFLPSTQFRKG